jgi:hypothetical protein
MGAYTVCVFSLKKGKRGGSFGRRYVGAALRCAGKMGRYAFWKRIFGGFTMGDQEVLTVWMCHWIVSPGKVFPGVPRLQKGICRLYG